MPNWWETGTFSAPDVSTDEADGLSAEHVVPSARQPGRLRDAGWRSLIILALVAMLALSFRGLDLWRARQMSTAAQRDALRQVIAAELVARQQSDTEAYLALLDPQADEAWRQMQVTALTTLPLPIASEAPPVIEHWQFQADAAVVDLRFAGPPATRETRFYRLVEGTWRRTAPIAALWGNRRAADAPGVHFVFQAADAQAVRGAVEALQTAYRQGNMPVLAGERLTVEIVPDYLVEYDTRQNRLILPSPRLSPRLASIPDSAPILWRLAHPIADRLADPADAARYRYLDSIQLFQDQLRYWSMRWQAPFPQRWHIQMLDTLRTARAERTLIVPRAIDLFSAHRTEAHLAYYETLTMADYVVERYGAAKLLALEQILSQVPTWERAVPAALGVDIATFERGWRAYLDTVLEPATPVDSSP